MHLFLKTSFDDMKDKSFMKIMYDAAKSIYKTGEKAYLLGKSLVQFKIKKYIKIGRNIIMNNKLLPIGSVVTLEGAEKKLMIVGESLVQEDDDTIYDYIGVPFPEGYIDSENMFLFMAKDIEIVNFVGYVNAESQAFRIKYAEYLKKKRFTRRLI